MNVKLTLAKQDSELLGLASLAAALGALEGETSLSSSEQHLAQEASNTGSSTDDLREVRDQILCGGDPLGERFLRARQGRIRRSLGAFYTPPALVTPMVQWVTAENPSRIVDAGCGSGRFALRAAKENPQAEVVAVDLDPLATLMLRAASAVLGLDNIRVINADFLSLAIPPIDGPTAWIGNPPYVRHHELPPDAKQWAKATARDLGHEISGLSGLHALFYLATASKARRGDIGTYVTSSEWLDVKYGSIVRELLLGELGATSVHVLAPQHLAFEGVQTTAAVSTFRVGRHHSTVTFAEHQSSDELSPLETGQRVVAKSSLPVRSGWSEIVAGNRRRSPFPADYIELGELCKVQRGAVTGANKTWIVDSSVELPSSVLFPTVTRARELFLAGTVLQSDAELKNVVDLPADLEEFALEDRESIERFLAIARAKGVPQGYIASHRRAWWSVGLKAPAPILATYMARQPPAFVLNAARARHVNIAHGIYPRSMMSGHAVGRLAESLRRSARDVTTRTYAGGLAKWEPSAMERLRVPTLEDLELSDPLLDV